MSDVMRETLEKIVNEDNFYDFETGELCTVDSFMKKLESFSNEPVVKVDENKRYATSALVSSESGDRFLVLEPGVKTKREIALETFACAPTFWGGFYDMRVEEIQTIEV